MGILRVLPAIEEWLDAEAESWSPISDRDYVALVRQWRDEYLRLIVGGTHTYQGERAIQAGQLVKVYSLAGLWLLKSDVLHADKHHFCRK